MMGIAKFSNAARVAAARAWGVRSLRHFRRAAVLPQAAATKASIEASLARFQRRTFALVDGLVERAVAGVGVPALASPEPPEGGTPTARYAWLERPRGHSKTLDAAVMVAWGLLAAMRPLEVLVAAADREQAELLVRAVERLKRANPLLLDPLEMRADGAVVASTGSRLRALSADVASSWGELPDLVICDELAHWEQPGMWESLVSSAAKSPHCALIVLTNAGTRGSWAWDIREHARQSADWLFDALDGPCAPWISEGVLRGQREILPRPIYERLWLNRWLAEGGDFLNRAEVEACFTTQRTVAERGTKAGPYIATVDYGERRDFTVGCVAHREEEKVVIDRLDVCVPSPEAPVPVDWVEQWIEEIFPRFSPVRCVVDEYQLAATVQKLSGRFPIERFNFASGRGNHEIATALLRCVSTGRLVIPAGCGDVRLPDGRASSFLEELCSLQVRTLPHGRFRFDHPQRAGYHDDRSFAVAVACHTLETVGVDDGLFIVGEMDIVI